MANRSAKSALAGGPPGPRGAARVTPFPRHGHAATWACGSIGCWCCLRSGRLGGATLDGWAHTHVPERLETFFTPWHAVLYSGFLASAAALVGGVSSPPPRPGLAAGRARRLRDRSSGHGALRGRRAGGHDLAHPLWHRGGHRGRVQPHPLCCSAWASC